MTISSASRCMRHAGRRARYGGRCGRRHDTGGGQVFARAGRPREPLRRAGGRHASRSPPQCSGRPGASLPEGYLPLSEVTDMTLLGSWPLLEDRMSPCMPTRIISAMQRRSSLGDREADTWLRMHAQACAGDPDAQRAFGRVCENGSYRTAADLQRAFFWYYRAGLQGDVEARRNAERLMHYAQRISPATMAEPHADLSRAVANHGPPVARAPLDERVRSAGRRQRRRLPARACAGRRRSVTIRAGRGNSGGRRPALAARQRPLSRRLGVRRHRAGPDHHLRSGRRRAPLAQRHLADRDHSAARRARSSAATARWSATPSST